MAYKPAYNGSRILRKVVYFLESENDSFLETDGVDMNLYASRVTINLISEFDKVALVPFCRQIEL